MPRHQLPTHPLPGLHQGVGGRQSGTEGAAFQMSHRAGEWGWADKETEAQRAVVSQSSFTRSPPLAPTPGRSPIQRQRPLTLLRLWELPVEEPKPFACHSRPLPQRSPQKDRQCEQTLSLFSDCTLIPPTHTHMHLGHPPFSPHSFHPSKPKSAATSSRQPSLNSCLERTPLPLHTLTVFTASVFTN